MAGEGKTTEIRCAIIPIESGNLILPNAVVREMMAHSPPEPLAGKPNWLLGEVLWRERNLALLSFEALCGLPYHGYGERKRVMVCAGLQGEAGISFYAIAASGIPRLTTVDQSKVKRSTGEFTQNQAILSHVEVSGQEGVIPDLDFLERKLGEVWQPAESESSA